jgi:hypothetical protein
MKGVDDTRVAILRADWLNHPETGPDEIAVMAVLSLHAGPDGTCWPSQSTIAAKLGRSRPWVNRTIARLCKLGLLAKTRRSRDDGGDRSCLYAILDFPGTDRSTLPVAGMDTPDSHMDRGCAGESHRKNSTELSPETHPTRAHEANLASSESKQGAELQLQDVLPEAQVPPADWQPSDDLLMWALDRFPDADLAAHVERFIARSRSKGYRYRDIGSGWKSWLVEDMTSPAGRRAGVGMPGRPSSAASHIRFAAWAAAARNPTQAA